MPDLETCPLNEPQPGSQGCSGMKRSKKGAMVFTKATEDRWVSGMGLSALGALVMGSRRRSSLTNADFSDSFGGNSGIPGQDLTS